MHMKPRLQKGLVMHKETRHYRDYTSSSMGSQPSNSDSCIGHILKFAIDVVEISSSFISSNLTSKAARKLFTIFFLSTSCNPSPPVNLYVFRVAVPAVGA